EVVGPQRRHRIVRIVDILVGPLATTGRHRRQHAAFVRGGTEPPHSKTEVEPAFAKRWRLSESESGFQNGNSGLEHPLRGKLKILHRQGESTDAHRHDDWRGSRRLSAPR